MNKRQLPVLLKDLGMLYPKLTSKHKAHYGLFKCECGKEFKTQLRNIKWNKTTSCGCYIKTKNSTHGLRNHKLYGTWRRMIQRCTNKAHKMYYYYGGRGIFVSKEWMDIKNFIRDMAKSYQDGLTLDRIDNNQGYSKENCKWSTKETQARNSRVLRKTNTSGYRGVSWHKNIKKWTAQINVNKKLKHLGTYSNKIEAAIAYNNYVIDNNLEHSLNNIKEIKNV